MSDKTNPSHYQLPNGLQVIDITRHFDFLTGNVLKYVCRAGRKSGESRLDDLSKAKWYLDFLIEDAIDAEEPKAWGEDLEWEQ